MRITRVFRSRWNALLWAGGVVWFAYDVANAQPHPQAPAANASAAATDATGSTVDEADLAVLANAMR